MRDTIQEQFAELQETVLLFLKNLRKVHVAFYNEEEEQTWSATYSVERPRSNYAVLRRTKVAGETSENEAKHFHVTTHEATNLAKNENRTYSEDEETMRAYSKSQVILAFPLSETSFPITKPQDLFVFLPVRPVGFKFLIQADLVTDANRQDIVKDSLRNNSLLDGIADAFIKAVLQFCEHDTLRYQWMRYLPDKSSTTWDTLWISLVNRIADRLSNISVLFGQKRPDRRLIRDMFRLYDQSTDENGRPLFDDEDPEQIVSQLYDGPDLGLLSAYGLNYASFKELNKWLRNDLRRGPRSRMKSPETSESWHTRAARLFYRPFAMKWDSRIKELKNMELLPLEDGSWVSASSGPIYFAQVDGMDIPLNLTLRLILRNVTNADRRRLFEQLGVKTAPIALVRKEILRRYLPDGLPSSLSLSTSKHHLKFLYLSQHLKDNEEPQYSRLAIYDNTEYLRKPFEDHVYIANAKPYGPQEVFKKTSPGPKPGDGAPGYAAYFVNEEYFRNSPATPQGQKLTWHEWFCSKLDVEEIVKFAGKTLGPAVKYLQENRPEKFLGCLRLGVCGSKNLSSDLIGCLLETKVLCRGNRRFSLKDTYFPTKELEKRVERFVEHGAFFPWLWLDAEITSDAISSGWRCLLTKLGVGSPSTDLDFALDMLSYSLDAFPSTINPTSRDRLFSLYDHIQAKFREDEDQVKAREKTRIMFSGRKCIYIPLAGNHCTWAFPEECVWNAQQELKSKYALKCLYEPWLCIEDSSSQYLAHFFTTTLGITECTWEIYIDELKALSTSDCDNIDTISGVYAALDRLRPQIFAISKAKVKAAFEDNALIYMPSDNGRAWHKVSQCVWSSAARLRGRVSLNDEYGSLEKLFVHFLGVKPVDLPMAIDELKEVGNRQSTSEQEVKESIWTVNSLLSTASQPPSPREILSSRIFPIKHPNGIVTLGSNTTEFFIVDREPFRRTFETKVKFPNFTLEEVAQLRDFVEWTRLGTKYLSHCVKEITSFYGGVASQMLNSDLQIKNRAYALLRIAAHFDSPRLRNKRNPDLYQLLRNASFLETNGISSGLSLVQDGVPHEAEGRKMTLHIVEDQIGLKIYVPQNKEDQEYVITKELSQRLFEWIMSDPNTNISEEINKDGVNATRDVLLAPRSKVDTALDDNGIGRTLDIVNVDEEVLSEPDSPIMPVRATEEGSGIPTPSAPADSDSHLFNTPASSVVSLSLDGRDAEFSGRNSEFTPSRPRPYWESPVLLPSLPSTPAPIAPVQVEKSNRRYVALLDKVINSGRRDALPSCGASGMSQLQSSMPSADGATDWGLRSTSQIERDCKVGAAGELYSNVRKYVKVHPEYATMEPWVGSETSDIIHADCEGALTRCLIEKGYLARDMWSSRRPKYFIEVKTTTMSCETRFFMSKAQYRRMKDNAITAESRDTIYVIFRVYNLGQDNMGVRIYLDPETLRLSEQLRFTAETWSVVPKIRRHFLM
ncbi:ino80 chromatin remodeling complex protein [Xylariales sp. AK1849]|nr:ino80 chromatin remodeling complex protein [Xylariales sp. AK1849]